MMSRKLVILYGSQTGSAQDVSEMIWRESKRFHYTGGAMPMDSYDISKQLIEEEIAIFVCSTTGQGEAPDNMIKFWKFLLRKDLPTDSLRNLNFGVIGLGDSSYPKFNFVAKRLHKRLLQLGASALLSTGLCDDQHDLGIGHVLYPWIENLWGELLKLKPIPPGLEILKVSPNQFRWEANVLSTDAPKTDRDIYLDSSLNKNSSDEGFLEVVETKRTTSEDHFQDVRLISFAKGNLNWNIGDVVYIRPQNLEENVKTLFDIFEEHKLNFHQDTWVELKEFDSEMPVPAILKGPHKLKTIATQYWDLSMQPRARFFELLAINCDDSLEKEKLIEFSSMEGQEELYSYINRPRRTILEVLQDFPHATSKLSLNFLFEIFQPMKQRPFSIASSVLSNRLDILVAVVEYKTKLKATRKGLCSNFLKTLKPGDKVPALIKNGSFKVPKDEDVPIIMVGPGTGIAPFRGMLQEFDIIGNGNSTKNPRFALFFGCRNESKDFHFRDDLKKWQSAHLIKLFCAFSRDQKDKHYVQHVIEKQGDLLRDYLVNRKGHFFVSGSSKNMPESVREALEKALDDKQFVEQIIKLEKYQEETWS